MMTELGVRPETALVHEELGLDTSVLRSKSIDEYLGKTHFAYHLITVCALVEERCPRIWPGASHHLHWPVDDPAEVQGEGRLSVGDDIMSVLVAGDIRDNVIGALEKLVGLLKTEVVTELEIS